MYVKIFWCHCMVEIYVSQEREDVYLSCEQEEIQMWQDTKSLQTGFVPQMHFLTQNKSGTVFSHKMSTTDLQPLHRTPKTATDLLCKVTACNTKIHTRLACTVTEEYVLSCIIYDNISKVKN